MVSCELRVASCECRGGISSPNPESCFTQRHGGTEKVVLPVPLCLCVSVIFVTNSHNKSWRYILACLVFLLTTSLLTTVSAFAVPNDEKSVSDAKRSLGPSTFGSNGFPWYSPETDDADFVPFPKEREYKERPQRDTGSFWDFFAKMGYWTLFGVGILVLAFILLLAWYVLYRNKDLFRKLWKKEEYAERKRRIETLPEEARDMFDDLIGAARRAMEAGDYRAAMIYYFSHQLVWLDMHGLIRMHKGKTNHEYARELRIVWPEYRRQTTGALRYYEDAMVLFESVYYGDHSISRLQFLGLWEDRQKFSLAVREEKQRREENQQSRPFGPGATAHRDSLTLTVDLPEMRPDLPAVVNAGMIGDNEIVTN